MASRQGKLRIESLGELKKTLTAETECEFGLLVRGGCPESSVLLARHRWDHEPSQSQGCNQASRAIRFHHVVAGSIRDPSRRQGVAAVWRSSEFAG